MIMRIILRNGQIIDTPVEFIHLKRTDPPPGGTPKIQSLVWTEISGKNGLPFVDFDEVVAVQQVVGLLDGRKPGHV